MTFTRGDNSMRLAESNHNGGRGSGISKHLSAASQLLGSLVAPPWK